VLIAILIAFTACVKSMPKSSMAHPPIVKGLWQMHVQGFPSSMQMAGVIAADGTYQLELMDAMFHPYMRLIWNGSHTIVTDMRKNRRVKRLDGTALFRRLFHMPLNPAYLGYLLMGQVPSTLSDKPHRIIRSDAGQWRYIYLNDEKSSSQVLTISNRQGPMANDIPKQISIHYADRAHWTITAKSVDFIGKIHQNSNSSGSVWK